MTVRRTLRVVAGFSSALALAACSGSTGDTGSTGTNADSADYAAMDCAKLAEEAVAISEDEDVSLLKVRDFKPTEDNRTGFVKPSSGDALLLSCTGTGIWSDTTQGAVRLEATVDSDGDTFIAYNQM